MATPSASQSGVHVRETGLAIVHQGEYVLPAAGSEAVLEPTAGNDQTVINYYFPVEIVVIGGICEATHQEIQARVWEKLGDALDRQGA